MDIRQAIRDRRSVRKYTSRIPEDQVICDILEAGIWAPSGLNNQPWKFKILREREQIDGLSAFTKYSRILKNAPVALCVFLDKEVMYHRDKDIQAIGSCIQNMLLQAHALSLSACWLGEILNRHEDVEEYLHIPSTCELMAVITLGFSDEKEKRGMRKPLKDVLL